MADPTEQHLTEEADLPVTVGTDVEIGEPVAEPVARVAKSQAASYGFVSEEKANSGVTFSSRCRTCSA